MLGQQGFGFCGFQLGFCLLIDFGVLVTLEGEGTTRVCWSMHDLSLSYVLNALFPFPQTISKSNSLPMFQQISKAACIDTPSVGLYPSAKARLHSTSPRGVGIQSL